MNLIEYPNRDTLMANVAKALVADLAEALAQRDTVCFAVPGGTTPGPLFDVLSTTALDWSRVHVLLTDERWVPENDAQSNAALIRARLLTGHASTAQFTPYYTDGADIDAAARNLSADLAHLLPIDVLLLGMGADMHTASLFPGSAGLAEAMAPDAQLLLPITIDGQQTRRFTLTAPALQNARKTHLLITGEEKRQALSAATTLPPMQAPVKTILSDAIIHWSAS